MKQKSKPIFHSKKKANPIPHSIPEKDWKIKTYISTATPFNSFTLEARIEVRFPVLFVALSKNCRGWLMILSYTDFLKFIVIFVFTTCNIALQKN